MQKRVTVRTIASAAGVHFTTAALALKDSPKVHAVTRQRVQECARELGYQSDPMVNALNFYRHSTRPAPFQGVLAWLSNETQPVMNEAHHYFKFFEGACEQAAALGYRLEEFALRAPGMTPERFVKILRSRGIQGILVGPQPLNRMGARIKMDWSPFSAVAIGHTLLWPPLNRVSSNQYRSIKLAIHHLISLGYRRIGFWTERADLNRVDGAWLGGYVSEMARRRMSHPAPMIADGIDADSMKSWMERERPDSVITFPAYAGLIAAACHLQIPEDLGAASLHVPDDQSDPFWAGIRQNDRQIGAEAIKFLVQSIHTQERGIPSLPKRVLVEATWRNGPSAQRIN